MCVSISKNNLNIQLKPLNISKNEPVKLRNLFPTENKPEANNQINVKDQNSVKLEKGSSVQSLLFVDGGKATQNAKLNKGDTWENGKVISVDVKGTTYKPADKKNIKMEGGVWDMSFDNQKKDPKYRAQHDLRNHTMEKYLENPSKAGYVAIALDKNLYNSKEVKYGDTFRIPELEKKLGKGPIIFKAVDTGGHFKGKGFKALDIAVEVGSKYEHDKDTNSSKLTLVKIK